MAKATKAKPARPTGHADTVSVSLGGRLRHFRCDFNALAMVEEHAGVNLIEDKDAILKLSIRKIRVLAWAFLLDEDPDLTIQQVGRMLAVGNSNDVVTKIVEALNLSAAEGTGDPKAAAARAG